jgi:predicted outer membrane repeat protein
LQFFSIYNIIKNNRANGGKGGAMFLSGSNSGADIEGVAFEGNVARDGGGGISVEKNSIVRMNSVIANNNVAVDPSVPADGDHVSSGGFLQAYFAGPLLVRNVSMGHNRADNSGGAMQLEATAGAFHKVVFENNTAKYGNGGALLATGSSEIHLLETTMTNNVAKMGAGGHVAISSSKLVVHDQETAMQWPKSAPTFTTGFELMVTRPTTMSGGTAEYGGSISATGTVSCTF